MNIYKSMVVISIVLTNISLIVLARCLEIKDKSFEKNIIFKLIYPLIGISLGTILAMLIRQI